MSIITAFASLENGVVGSDGRLFSPAHFDGDQLVTPADIDRDDFDKTFMVGESILIGAFCGLMYFNSLTISEHIQELVLPVLQQTDELETLIDTIDKGICNRLQSISSQEVIFDHRAVNLLLIGRLPNRNMETVKMSFFPKKNKIQSVRDIAIVGKRNEYHLFGDDKASKNARRVFKNNKASNRDAKFLTGLVTKSIQIGTKSSGVHPYSDKAACGGKIFTRAISKGKRRQEK